MSYNAVVGRIYTNPHPNADRLKVGHIHGAVVIVGLDTNDGDLYVYFECDGQLSEAFAKANNLYRDRTKNADQEVAGFFEDNRRVRAQPFRGVKSEGFALPVSAFAFTGYDISSLKEGDQFCELNGVPICNKYYTPATIARIAAGNAQPTNPLKASFPQHYDTAQFRYAHLEQGDLIVITEKEHGTSVRYGHVEVTRPSKGDWLYRWLVKKGWVKQRFKTTQEYVLGTRRAILNPRNVPVISLKNGMAVKRVPSNIKFEGGYYGDGEPYNLVAELLHNKLRLGEIVYGECLGYTSNGSPLFTHSLTKLPELEKRYGSPIEYSYGCEKGKSRFRVYRITHNGRDLSWFEIQKRAEELGIETVTEVFKVVYDGNREALNAKVQSYLEGPSLLDNTHIREGVCIRVENKYGHKVYKEKSYSFKVAEGIAKDNQDYVDAEEVA